MPLLSRLGLCLVALAAIAGCTTSSSSSKGGSGLSGTGGTGDGTSTKFFLPTGEPTNTSAPSIEVDAQGGIHAVYPRYVIGGAFYAYCPAGCTGPDQMKVVDFETEGTVHNSMLALDAEGRPHVLLSTAQKVYYAEADGDFADPSAWTQSMILDHGGDREVTGEALALDPEGRPRFIMHTYKAYLGVGQKAQQAFFVACDSDCTSADSWKVTKIADQMWRGSSLKYDANGVAKLATVITMGANQNSSGTPTGAYVECASDCDTEEGWKGIGLVPAWENELEAVRVLPAISLALTKNGAPRIAMLGVDDFKRNMTYFECDEDCSNDNWRGSRISDHEKLGAGIDLALDQNDKPRIAHTLDYNIAIGFCDEADCTAPDAAWDLGKVEYGGELKPDDFFLEWNCTISAWFLHSPSIALTADGRPRVGYQARDISGGFSQPEKLKPRCVAGTDMTWSRLSIMSAVKQ